MRYDKRIYFVKEGEDEYDYATGDYVATEPIKHEVWANVSDIGTQRQTLIFGALKQGALTIRIQGNYKDSCDYIEYNGKKYNISTVRTFRHDQAFEVSEQL